MVGARESHSQTRSRTRTAVVWSALSDRLEQLAGAGGDLHVLDIESLNELELARQSVLDAEARVIQAYGSAEERAAIREEGR